MHNSDSLPLEHVQSSSKPGNFRELTHIYGANVNAIKSAVGVVSYSFYCLLETKVALRQSEKTPKSHERHLKSCN